MKPVLKIPTETWWVLSVGSQAGLMLVGPVLLGIAAGYWLDRQLGTLPVITLVLTLAGAVGGPIMVYRWVILQVGTYMNRQDQSSREK